MTTTIKADRVRPESDQLLTEDQAAEILSTKPQTLAVWRTTGRYKLPYVKIGRNVRYRLRDVLAFIEARTVTV